MGYFSKIVKGVREKDQSVGQDEIESLIESGSYQLLAQNDYLLWFAVLMQRSYVCDQFIKGNIYPISIGVDLEICGCTKTLDAFKQEGKDEVLMLPDHESVRHITAWEVVYLFKYLPEVENFRGYTLDEALDELLNHYRHDDEPVIDDRFLYVNPSASLDLSNQKFEKHLNKLKQSDDASLFNKSGHRLKQIEKNQILRIIDLYLVAYSLEKKLEDEVVVDVLNDGDASWDSRKLRRNLSLANEVFSSKFVTSLLSYVV